MIIKRLHERRQLKPCRSENYKAIHTVVSLRLSHHIKSASQPSTAQHT